MYLSNSWMNFEKCSHPCKHNYNKNVYFLSLQKVTLCLFVVKLLPTLCHRQPQIHFRSLSSFVRYLTYILYFLFKAICYQSSSQHGPLYVELGSWSHFLSCFSKIHSACLFLSLRIPLLVHFLLHESIIDFGHKWLPEEFQCQNRFTSKFQWYYFFRSY